MKVVETVINEIRYPNTVVSDEQEVYDSESFVEHWPSTWKYNDIVRARYSQVSDTVFDILTWEDTQEKRDMMDYLLMEFC